MRAWLLTTACLLIPTIGLAGSKKEDKAIAAVEEAASVYAAALRAQDWETSSRLIEPDALVKFQEILQPVVAVGIEKEDQEFLNLFDGVDNYDALDAMEPAEYFASFLGGMTSINPMFGEALSSMTYEPIGTVLETPEQAHVVYRSSMDMGEMSITQVDVMSFRKVNNGWYTELNADIEGMAEQIRQMAQAQMFMDSMQSPPIEDLTSEGKAQQEPPPPPVDAPE